MEKSQWYIGAPNGVVLCIDEAKEEAWRGRFYHGYSREAVEISGPEELVYGLEKLYDELKFPHRTTNSRSFQEEQKDERQKQERERVMQDKELLSRHGDLGTFIIRVQHRQNSSWQGRVTWMDEDKTVYFRSIWEMIKLIDSALGTDAESDPTTTWLSD